jgi:hypothetical protein
LISSKTIGSGSGYLQVQTHDSTYRYSLSTNREIHVQGPLGTPIISRTAEPTSTIQPVPPKAAPNNGPSSVQEAGSPACPTKSC